MAGFAGSYYPVNPAEIVPTVDHDHRRSRQHEPLWRYLGPHRQNEEQYPNQPDVDIRDMGAYYLVDVEVPGVKDANTLHLQWTDASTLVVSGSTSRPEDEEAKLGHDGNKVEHIMIGERKVGAFKRR